MKRTPPPIAGEDRKAQGGLWMAGILAGSLADRTTRAARNYPKPCKNFNRKTLRAMADISRWLGLRIDARGCQ
jgi:hypothetical protein